MEVDEEVQCNETIVNNNKNDEVYEVVDSNIPMIGLLFESVNDMFEFYKRYGKSKGFSVKRRSITKDKDGIRRYLIFSCGRSDRYISRSKSTINHRAFSKNSCKARLVGRMSIDGKWEITKFDDDHNHGFSPSQSRFFRCNREISLHVKRQLEINDIARIRPNKSHNAMVIGAGGHDNLSFLEKDTRNIIASTRRMRLGIGDAEAVKDYFLQMQASNHGFFSLIDWDDNGRLRNIFWADPRSRVAFKEFGDVVTFDTTYLTNKYDMPFAPFVGVNHHGQSILLGCGLISSEDTETFVWLFKTWLICMGGVAPHGIITDQDRAMKNAIEIVFPTTRHRLCLWHIMKKVPEKFGSHTEYEGICRLLATAVYDSQTIDEFEGGWSYLLGTYDLENNNWFSSLYLERELWVPIYVKKHFWAGMSTTGRSESMNAFFDGYVHSKTTLKQFVEQYDNALRKKIEKENQAEFDSLNKQIPCSTFYEMEKQIQKLYTAAKFKEFQKELIYLMYCGIKSVDSNECETLYVVYENILYAEGFRKKLLFNVSFDGCNVTCSCLGFEFRGIMCKHALTVLIHNDKDMLPEQYVFKRWRKDIRRCHMRVKIKYEGSELTIEKQRYDDLCSSFNVLADFAVENEENYFNVKQWIDHALTTMETEGQSSLITMSSNSNDPIVKRGKGRPPSVMKRKIFRRKRGGSTNQTGARPEAHDGGSQTGENLTSLM